MTSLTGFRYTALLIGGVMLLSATTPLWADVIGDCGPPTATENPLYRQALQAKERVDASAAAPDRKRQFADRWTPLQTTQRELKTDAARNDTECRTLKAAADATLGQIQACQTQCNQAAGNQSAYRACQACAGQANADLARREAEYAAYNAKLAPYNARVQDWEGRLKTFITDAEAAIPRGFTGKRFYHLFAKSWINGPAITEPTWAARKIKMDVNVEPTQAMAGSAFDYKIYQSFGVETEFVDGKIVRATFVSGSKQQLANTTFGFRGEVRVTHDEVSISPDKTRVVFERRIEGNPHIIIKAADLAAAEAVARSWGLDLPATDIKIYNRLRLTVTAEGATPFGEGSAFPTHYFWIRDSSGERRFGVQPQVQPSKYFR